MSTNDRRTVWLTCAMSNCKRKLSWNSWCYFLLINWRLDVLYNILSMFVIAHWTIRCQKPATARSWWSPNCFWSISSSHSEGLCSNQELWKLSYRFSESLQMDPATARLAVKPVGSVGHKPSAVDFKLMTHSETIEDLNASHPETPLCYGLHNNRSLARTVNNRVIYEMILSQPLLD
jgi:hypothetical protein